MDKLEKEFCKRNEEIILDKAGSFFNISKESLKSVGGGFANFVYEYEKNGQGYILRFTLNSYRTVEMVKGELDWIKYLYDNNVPVAKPISLTDSSLVGQFKVEGKIFSVVSFEKLEGEIGEQIEWSKEIIQQWGQIMGKIHALSKEYRPKDKDTKRLEWYEDELIEKEEKYIPNYEIEIIEKLKDIKKILGQFPKDINSYGMIHGDFSAINFMVNNGNIFVYDFDDCGYNWFAMDIAKSLYYSMWRNPNSRAVKDNRGYADYFLSNFMKGYSKENTLESFWLEHIPIFLKLHEIYMYKLGHREFDIYNLKPNEKEFLRRYKYNIENDIPYIESAFFPWG